MAESIASAAILAVEGSRASARQDRLAVEEPLEIRLQYCQGGRVERRSLAITMRTPGHDRELALGFLAGEGIVSDFSQVASCGHTGSEALRSGASNVIKVCLRADVAVDFERLQRHFYASSSCGVCGRASLAALERIGAEPLPDGEFRIPAERLHQLGGRLRARQEVFLETGGLHAAALFDSRGRPICLREDVGRHNAMDKVCGRRLRDGGGACGAFVSGRASFELMQKALLAGIPLLAAVGAPSSLAVDFAVEYNMSLVGFMRGGRFNIYAGRERITLS